MTRKPFQSKLRPHLEFIRECRAQEMSYPQIAAELRARLHCLSDLSWGDLVDVMRPTSGIRLSRLVYYRDPYRAISNPFEVRSRTRNLSRASGSSVAVNSTQ